MDCASAREAISALLDGEPAGVGGALLEEHLVGCSACRAWRDSAHELNRRSRLSAAHELPRPSPQLLAVAAEAWKASRPRFGSAVTRVGLVAVAAAQAVFALPDLVFGSDHGAPVHVAHETGSFDVALAVGFLVAAWRPARAQGMRALVGCVALLLVGTAVVDLLAGRTTVLDEAPHLLAVAGWLLLRHLSTLLPSSSDDEAGLPVLRRAWQSWRLAWHSTAHRQSVGEELLVAPSVAGSEAAAPDDVREPERFAEPATPMTGEGRR